MTFTDIFKSSFLENVKTFSIVDITLALAFACVIGLFIYMIYKKTFNGVMYSGSFGVTLVGLTLITTLVILAVTSNVVLSLGMVGALSIVRFRTAIKEPVEIIYLFWSLAAGIVIGAGLIPMAVIGSLFIGLFLIVFANRKSHDNPYMLMLSCENDTAEKALMNIVSASVKKYAIKTKTVNTAGIELAIEIRMKDASTAFINQLAQTAGTNNAALVSYNGEYMS